MTTAKGRDDAGTSTGWILWAGTLGLEGPIEDRIRAATATDCQRVSMSALDVARAEADGRSATDLGRWVRDAGLEIVFDPVMNWWPGPHADNSRFAQFTVDQALRMANDLAVVSMTAIGPREGTFTPDELVGPFGDLCDRAETFHAAVHLEFIPMTQVPDLQSAWDIVREADRPNGGLLFDTWHYFRGTPNRDLLATIPGDRILAVQVDDGPAQPNGTLWEDTRERLLPGDGAFDIVGALCDLAMIGGLTWVGPEVISTSTADAAARSPIGMATTAMDRVRTLVKEAHEACRLD